MRTILTIKIAIPVIRNETSMLKITQWNLWSVISINYNTIIRWYKVYDLRSKSYYIVKWKVGFIKAVFVKAISHKNNPCQVIRATFVFLLARLLFYQSIAIIAFLDDDISRWFWLITALERNIDTSNNI